MPIELVCPISRRSLIREDGAFVSPLDGTRYPIVDGIPILLPDATERERIAARRWSEGGDHEGAVDFYNDPADHEQYCRAELPEERTELTRWLREAPGAGPILEIGSGRGALLGLAPDEVALDYSFTALSRYVRPDVQRVCGTAERLPFPDGSARLIYTVAALEHVPAVDRAFAEIDRVLRPGGIAYVAPAWHCLQDNCEGIPVRPYRDLSWRQRARKATLPVRTGMVAKGVAALPGRLLRRIAWRAGGSAPIDLRYVRLRPDYSRFWMSDSDAVSRIDSHEGALFFHSRRYEMLRPGPTALGSSCPGTLRSWRASPAEKLPGPRDAW